VNVNQSALAMPSLPAFWLNQPNAETQIGFAVSPFLFMMFRATCTQWSTPLGWTA
jgi:hypothetical protein